MLVLEKDRTEALAILAQPVLPRCVTLATSDPTAPATGLWPQECEAVARAVEKRRREFAAGRRAARTAIRRLGANPCAILRGDDRAPIWPHGITGSISHSSDVCIAVAAATDRIAAIGIDVEEDRPIDADLIPMICTPDEIVWLADVPAVHRRRLARIMFSAKEAAYKCQYTLTGEMMGFGDMTIRFEDSFGRFVAELNRDVSTLPAGTRFLGQLVTGHGMILTVVAVQA